MTLAWAVVMATGKEQELVSGVETAFLGIGSRPVLAHVLEAYEACRDIEGVIVAASRERMEMVFAMSQRFGINKVRKENVILGGAARRITLESALRRMEDEVDHVVVQDVCRPFVTPAMISAVLAAAGKSGCAVTGEPVRDPLRQVSKKGLIEGGDPEGDLWLVQSPQAYRRSLLEKALAAAQKKKLAEPEESALMPLVKAGVQMVAAERRNPRLRDATDLAIASQFLP